jgi:transketolase
MSLRPTFAQVITEIADADERLVTIVGDISHGIFKDLRKRHHNRYYNIGICEPSMVGIASGMSAGGLIPVVHTITPFLIERSFEQIKLDFGYQKLGVNLVSVGGAFDYSKLGCTHHSYSDYAIVSQIESSNIFFPGSAMEFELLFRENYANGKINYFRLTEYPHKFDLPKHSIVTGKSIKLISGDDLTLVAVGSSLREAEESCVNLKTKGISVDLIYLHSLKPLDTQIIVESVKHTQKLVIISQTNSRGGIASEILSTIPREIFFLYDSLEIQDFVREYGTYDYLLEVSGLSSKHLTEKIMRLFN